MPADTHHHCQAHGLAGQNTARFRLLAFAAVRSGKKVSFVSLKDKTIMAIKKGSTTTLCQTTGDSIVEIAEMAGHDTVNRVVAMNGTIYISTDNAICSLAYDSLTLNAVSTASELWKRHVPHAFRSSLFFRLEAVGD